MRTKFDVVQQQRRQQQQQQQKQYNSKFKNEKKKCYYEKLYFSGRVHESARSFILLLSYSQCVRVCVCVCACACVYYYFIVFFSCLILDFDTSTHFCCCYFDNIISIKSYPIGYIQIARMLGLSITQTAWVFIWMAFVLNSKYMIVMCVCVCVRLWLKMCTICWYPHCGGINMKVKLKSHHYTTLELFFLLLHFSFSCLFFCRYFNFQ